MRRILAATMAAIAIGGLPAAASGSPRTAGVHAVASKTCSAGYTHAVIGGSHKCLRRGQFCAPARDREYHRYGYHCHKRDNRGNYHLT